MTAVSPGGAAPSPPASAPTPGASAAAGSGRSTPTRLRTVQALLALVCVALGVVLFVGASTRSGQISQAQRASDLVVAAQDLRSALGQADAASASAFLAGGVDQPQQRERYGTAIDAAATALQQAGAAADSEEADAAVAEMQRLLPTYTGLIETARANNRQALPLGAAYLRSASDLLRTDVDAQLAALRDAGDASFREVDGDLTGGLGVVTLAAIVVVAVAFVLAARWLAGRTRRLLNVGVLAAAALLLVGLGWIATSNRSSAADAADGADGYDRLSALTAVRSDAYDHQARVAFAFVDPGGRLDHAARADTAAGNVDARLEALDDRGGLADDWQEYLGQSQAILDLDPARLQDAIGQLTAPLDEPASVAAAFARFDDGVIAAVDDARRELGAGLDDARGPIDRIRIVGVVLAVLAAAIAAWGVQQRINDYR